jgi:hypothetical protein
MGSFTTAGKNDMLDDWDTSTTYYVGLLVASTEVTGNNYSRVEVTFGAASGGVKSNSAIVVFPTPSGSWGTVDEVAIYTASSGGTKLASHTVSQAVGSGVAPRFLAGTITLTL